MNLLRAIGRFLLGALKVLRLALPKLGVGWMFALLTSNFNRVSIVELGVMAIIVTTMIGLHHFLSPFQVVWGRIADSHPVFGLRRTPYCCSARRSPVWSSWRCRRWRLQWVRVRCWQLWRGMRC